MRPSHSSVCAKNLYNQPANIALRWNVVVLAVVVVVVVLVVIVGGGGGGGEGDAIIANTV